MNPLWAALAGLAIGMAYAAVQRLRSGRKKPASRSLDSATVEKINDLVEGGKPVRAIKVLRQNTELSLVEGKNRIDDWRIDEERAAVPLE